MTNITRCTEPGKAWISMDLMSTIKKNVTKVD